MTVETFFANFGHLADAPNGVQKLRELILQLAVQGKLVPQDPSDEPASVLLEKIRAHKVQLIAAGKLKSSKSSSEISSIDEPFALPKSWIFVRFGDVTICRDGERVPLSREVRSVRKGPCDYYGASGVIDKLDDYLFETPLLLIGEDGANLINRSTPIAFIATGKYWVNNHAHVLDGFSVDFLKYMELFVNAIDLKPYVTGTAQPKMNQAKMNSIVVPLPPFEEQKRIVAKVDQLMALCDELEARQQKQQQGRVRLNNATLDALLDAQGPDEFADQWQRISSNFDLLYDHPETIAKLRAAILQLAVQGKLVAQDPNDEPASVLLERIKAEKERLVKKFKVRPPGTATSVSDEDLPFLLPQGWSWLRLSDCGVFLGGGTPSKQRSEYWDGDIPWVSPKDMKVQYLSDSIDHITEKAIENSSAKLIPEGAVLMVLRGMILIHSFPVAKTTREVVVNQDMKALIPALPETSEYILRTLIAEKDRVLGLVERSSHGTCRIDTDKLLSLVIALPPFAEQKRIVAKVDQLMALCDELEAKLNQAQQHSEKLMEATVRQLLVA